MPAAKIKKAIISTRYPTARDMADLLQVPMGRVLRLAEELMQFQVRPASDSRRAARNGAQSEKRRGTRTVKKRAARAR